MKDAVITVKDVDAGYTSPVVREISFDVYAGEIFVILAVPAAARARCSST